VAGTVITTR